MIEPDTAPYVIAASPNWEAWSIDLDTRATSPVPGIERMGAQQTVLHVDGRTFLLAPNQAFDTTQAFEILPDGTSRPAFTIAGWSERRENDPYNVVRSLRVHAVILIAPDGVSGALRGLMDRLASVGVTVTIVDEIATAVEMSGRHARPPAVMLDLRDVGAGEVEDVRKATEAVRRTLSALPHALPIVVTTDALAPLIVACTRSGAGDVIDLALEGTATARSVVLRICQRQAERARELDVIEQQRSLIEDLLKDLIQTERRVIDAEELIAARGTPSRTTREISTVEARPPAVLLVESERQLADELADLLEAAGVATFAYVSGEEALREADGLAATSGIDLALVATLLPGIDGLETVRRLREGIADLPAFLLTSPDDVDSDLTAAATELGVVGFVQKPLSRIDDVVEQLAALAQESQHRTRESRYLQRIKERHDRVLARYRSLPRVP